MREIKFRFWKDGVMYQAGESMILGGTLQDFNPMQYTGLKDKNGKEIYEGDILSYNNGYAVFEVKNEMVRNCSCCHSVWGWNLHDAAGPDEDFDHIWTHEVIGNIYENPELLEK